MTGVMPRMLGRFEIGAMLQQQLDRRRIQRLGGAQQRRRADRQHPIDAAIGADVAVRRQQLQLQVRIRAASRAACSMICRLVVSSSDGRSGRPPCGSVFTSTAQIQRAAAPPVPLVDVRAGLDQIRGRVEVHVP